MSANVTSRRTRRAVEVVAATTAVALIAGCGSSIQGSPRAEGASSSGDRQQFTALLEECNAVTEDQIARTVGADAIERGFFGAICRWDTVGATGPAKVTFNWFETGSLDTEKATGEKLGYAVESSTVQGRRSVVMRPPDDPGSCGVTVGSPSGGIVGWWVQFKTGAADPCDTASTLVDLTLNLSS
ncbi:DUF3558 domain-containing protein [Rhodococcus marinonascens]|uniref:DUF3558 domain-containing protein n=1 Tax=Rhodococcus marinonascens TaxID=38311 RepID=UPI0009345E2B|nr:DUF3558 domain-containing protein [Rhodococcus marinonascens]